MGILICHHKIDVCQKPWRSLPRLHILVSRYVFLPCYFITLTQHYFVAFAEKEFGLTAEQWYVAYVLIISICEVNHYDFIHKRADALLELLMSWICV
jgi:hypothetical protein